MNTPDREHILLKHFAGELTAEQERELAAWREAEPDHDALYTAYHKLWHTTAPAGQPLPVDLDAEWDRLRRRLRLGAPRQARILPLRRHGAMLAAAAAVFIAVGGAIVLALMSTTAQTVTVATANAETQTVTLADGSTVRVNNGSALTYPATFDEAERRVRLDGEAFFEVVAGNAPFVVEAVNAEVRVLGTAFNVWTRQQETRVAVREGRVALGAPGTAEGRVEITANQAAVRRAAAPPAVLDPAYTDAALGWLDGRIVFERAPLAEVVAELQRVYDQPIQLQAPSLAAATITGGFTGRPLGTVLASICLSVNCQVVEQEGGYVITE